MHSTKTATTIAKVNSEGPMASAPMRLKVVCSAIIAKPAKSETPAQAANRATGSTADGFERSGTTRAAPRSSCVKTSAAKRFTQPIA